MNYKIRKIFDCQDMPEDLRKSFFRLWDMGNNSFTEWIVGDSIYEEDDPSIQIEKWLIENGAEEGEEVCIHYWW